jgi:hypothetical protein
MSFTKCTMLFELATNKTAGLSNNRIGGWSETWYRTTITGLKGAFETLCQARARLLPNGALVVGQRYQELVLGGGSQTASARYPGIGGNPADVPQMALLCRASAQGAPNRRGITLRGIPDAVVVQGEYAPTTNFTNDLQAFFTLLKSNLWRFRGKDLTATQVPLISISSAGLATTALAHSFSNGTVVRILRAAKLDKEVVSGLFTLGGAAPTGTTFTMPNWGPDATTGGLARLEGTVYPVVNEVNISRVVVRKVGRPFSGYRGRASNRQ